MHQTQNSIRRFGTPDRSLLGDDPESFLRQLGGPAWIEIEGNDSSRRRVIVTLLHGNEPSGLQALHKLLCEGIQPATNLGILIAAVDAALSPPVLSHRYIPGEKDLNRCFGDRHRTNQSLLANEMLEIIHEYEPDLLVDTHNTSSHSVAFCISVHNTSAAAELAGHFSDHLVILNQALGTLLEHLDPGIPAITVEFGGFMDEGANALALSCLERIITADNLDDRGVMPEVHSHSMRLETTRKLKVSYSSAISEDSDLTIINTIDQLNFRKIPPGTTLGWFRSDSHSSLSAFSTSGKDVIEQYFDQSTGVLRTQVAMTIFMATTDPDVANTDCLLYFTTTG